MPFLILISKYYFILSVMAYRRTQNSVHTFGRVYKQIYCRVGYVGFFFGTHDTHQQSHMETQLMVVRENEPK